MMVLSLMTDRTDTINAYRSAWMIALFALLRTSEFLVESKSNPDPLRLLRICDVEWVPNRRAPQYIRIHIRASKTDFWRVGVWITIGVTGCSWFCAVTELRTALSQRFGGLNWDPEGAHTLSLTLSTDRARDIHLNTECAGARPPSSR